MIDTSCSKDCIVSPEVLTGKRGDFPTDSSFPGKWLGQKQWPLFLQRDARNKAFKALTQLSLT